MHVTRSIAYKYGLANGTRGTLVGVVYPAGGKVCEFPEALVVDVPGYRGPKFYKDNPTWVVILPKVSHREGTRQMREQFPVSAGYAMTINKAQGLTLPEGVVIKLSTGPRFKAAAKHGLPFVAFTRSESFAMTAFDNLPSFQEFQKGLDSEMLRIRLDFTRQLNTWHARGMTKVFGSAALEQKAFEEWTDSSRQKARARAPAQARCSCPGCDLEYPT